MLANINALTCVLHTEQIEKVPKPSDQSEDRTQSKKISFDFGSNLSAEWKDCVTNMLNSVPELFSQHELDFGQTEKVHHQIKLSEETPPRTTRHWSDTRI